MTDQFFIAVQLPLTWIPIAAVIAIVGYMVYLAGEQLWDYIKSKFNSPE